MEQVSAAEIWDYHAGHAWIFVVRGDLDAHLAAELRGRLDRALTDSPQALLVDLEEATFMDASAVGVLVTAFQAARAGGCVLRLVAPSAPAERVLRLTQTEDVFVIERDLSTAYERAAVRAADPDQATGFDDAA